MSQSTTTPPPASPPPDPREDDAAASRQSQANARASQPVPLPILAETPEENRPPHIVAPAHAAAGIPAVLRSMKHLFTQVPPVAATRAMLKLNQKGGIDCMSCAWPENDGKRHVAEFCENGAKAVAWEADATRCGPEFFARYSVAELSQQSDHWLGQQGRLTHPMILRENATHYEPISWDAAFEIIARELNALTSPDEAIFYTSGRTSNEAAFLYQLFVRQFGTNNLPDCSNMCHESSGAALSETIGIGKGTVTIDDFNHAQLILIIGQNPGTNHPRMLTSLEAAKKAGAKIIAINPLPEAGLMRFKNPQTIHGMLLGGTALCDLFLQVRVAADIPLLKALGKLLLERDAVDRSFIASQTTGFEAYADDLRNTPIEPLLDACGVSRELLERAAEWMAGSERIIACWAMGMTQNKFAVAGIQEVVNLMLLRGSIGKPGAGLCPVRGHSNVQGDRTMGIWERPPAKLIEALRKNFNFEPPTKIGFDVVESIHAMQDGRGKIFFAMGGNFLSAAPDTAFTAVALQNTRLSVQVSIKLNRSHLVTGKQALILPTLGRTEIDKQAGGEQFVSTENSMGVVEMSRGILKPASPELLSETAIVCRLAEKTQDHRSTVDWPALSADYDRVREMIAATIPGCEHYNEKVRKPGGFYLPNAPRDGDFSNARAKKAMFTVHSVPDLSLAPGQLAMMTVRSHDQFNTTIYGMDDKYRGIRGGRRVIFLNEQDLAERGIKSGDYVDISSHFAGRTITAARFLAIVYPIPRFCAATYFPEANVLVPIGSTADGSNTPSSKYVVITVEKSVG